MTKKKSPNDLHWEAENKKQIRKEYNEFLVSEGKEDNPQSAHLFAIKKISGSYDYLGMKERELILFLSGDLPYMYD